jgi:hypothetical protein
MVDIEDIPNIPDQRERIQEVTVDCYGQSEELSAMEVYLMDAIRYPFEATWRDPDAPDHAEPVTVLSFGATDERRGILLEVQHGSKNAGCWPNNSGLTMKQAPTPLFSTTTVTG